MGDRKEWRWLGGKAESGCGKELGGSGPQEEVGSSGNGVWWEEGSHKQATVRKRVSLERGMKGLGGPGSVLRGGVSSE